MGQEPSLLRFAPCSLPLAFTPRRAAGESPPFVGYLAWSYASTSGRIEAFRQGLRELGYVEGKNIVIEWRHAEANPGRPSARGRLVRLKVDVIVTPGATDTRTAKEATATIPIVMARIPIL